VAKGARTEILFYLVVVLDFLVVVVEQASEYREAHQGQVPA